MVQFVAMAYVVRQPLKISGVVAEIVVIVVTVTVVLVLKITTTVKMIVLKLQIFSDCFSKILFQSCQR